MKISNFSKVSILLLLISIFFACQQEKEIINTYQGTLLNAPDQAHQLKIQKDLQSIQMAVQMYYSQNHRYPEDLEQLVEEGHLSMLPKDPYGGDYLYDPETGQVKYKSER